MLVSIIAKCFLRWSEISKLLLTVVAIAFAVGISPQSVNAESSKPIAVSHLEFFSPKKFGPASPRVTSGDSAIPSGGGRRVEGRVSIKDKTVRNFIPGETQIGTASWYGDAFHGRKTANRETYDVTAITAAHPALPLPCYVRVTNLSNGRSLIVRVNDRGPYVSDRIMDLSKRAARQLGFVRKGITDVQVTYLGKAGLAGGDNLELLATLRTNGDPAKFEEDNLQPQTSLLADLGT